MDRIAAIVLAGLLAAPLPAAAHPATELYIPIGQSPGISGLKSRIGRIQSLAAGLKGMTIATPDGPVYVAFDARTRVYLQYEDPRQPNAVGTYADCRADRMAEAYVADDGTVPWIKVRIPR